MRLLSVAEMQHVEQEADAVGHTYEQMMELAGQGVARALLQRAPVKGRRVLVLVGPGNNGGDGLVAARYLTEAGARVTAYLSRPRKEGDDPVYRQAVERGVKILSAAEDPEGQELTVQMTRAHVLIDALLGTGATPPLRSTIRTILEQATAALEERRRSPLTFLNRAPDPPNASPFIVAVDGPSGMDFDTGEIDLLTLHAELTVTFAYAKRGHFRFPAADHVGELAIADIGIPERVGPPAAGPRLTTPSQIRTWLPARSDDSHKGTYGKALIVAGSVNYTGAAGLAALGAVRGGAGLVTLGIASTLHPALVSLVPEATYLLLPHVLGAITPAAWPLLTEQLEEYDALLVGPGLGRTPETVGFVRALCGLVPEKRPTGFARAAEAQAASNASPNSLPALVVDADGLNILSQLPDWPTLLPPETILTPHPGEMARLAGLEPAAIQEARLETAQEYAQAWGHVVVLKGAFTVVAAPDGRTHLLPFANSGLASAGTGDVLAGLIVALRAQGLEAFEAAVTGAYVHGAAGEVARVERGKMGMAARDVAEALPTTLTRLRGAR